MKRWYRNLKAGCIRVATPLSLEDTRRLVAEFVTSCKTVRLHCAIAYITPADKLGGRASAIWAARRQKLTGADARRRSKVKENEVDQLNCCAVHRWSLGGGKGNAGRDLRADPGPRPEGRHDAARIPAPGSAPKR